VEDVSLGQVAYTAYGRTTGFKNYQGLPMPSWEDLGDTIRRAWENAASAAQSATRILLAAAQSRANYADVWAELEGWVQGAYQENARIDPAELLGYMDELRHRAHGPLRAWMNNPTGAGEEGAR
jgi:hypothetical protein